MDGDGGGVQVHTPLHVFIPVTGSMDFPTISCSLDLLPQCPVGICGSRTKAPGQPGLLLNMLKKHWRSSSVFHSLSPFLSLTHPPIKLPTTSSSRFIRGTGLGWKKRLLSHRKERRKKHSKGKEGQGPCD